MHVKYLAGTAAIALLAAGMATGPTTALATAHAKQDRGVVSNTTMENKQAVKSVWTPERMAAAKPLPVNATQLKTGARAAKATPSPAGRPSAVQPARGSLAVGAARATAPVGKIGQAVRIPRPYGTLASRTNAKVFLKQDGGYYVCSGTLVNSPTKNMVSTAGHCVSDGNGHWSSDILVVPAYSSKCDGCDNAPFGVWYGSAVTTRTQWHYNSNLLQDVGYITLDKNSAGKNAVSLLGGRGTKWNLRRGQTFTAVGYPAAAPFTGSSQYKSRSLLVRNDDPSGGYWTGPKTMAIWSNMTGGASGGAWMANGYQNGLNSYRYISGPKANARQMYGPYFGTAARNLFSYTVKY
jgi:V8-like Glu-specific endopeptidase